MDFLCSCSILSGSFPDWITAMIAVIAVFLTSCEYKAHVERDKFQALSEFNQRFMTDKTLVKVTKWLSNKSTSEETASPEETPTDYDFEIYGRFGEELEIAIQKDYLSEQNVYDLFWYYFDFDKKKGIIGILKEIEKDEYDKNWKILNQFKERMDRLKPLNPNRYTQEI
ncbi:MAG: hypothetical protein K2I64_06000 [Muribaculaceae bacterium]|nr:hypothetical protein [Muribaculaceae bacterium]